MNKIKCSQYCYNKGDNWTLNDMIMPIFPIEINDNLSLCDFIDSMLNLKYELKCKSTSGVSDEDLLNKYNTHYASNIKIVAQIITRKILMLNNDQPPPYS